MNGVRAWILNWRYERLCQKQHKALKGCTAAYKDREVIQREIERRKKEYAEDENHDYGGEFYDTDLHRIEDTAHLEWYVAEEAFHDAYTDCVEFFDWHFSDHKKEIRALKRGEKAMFRWWRKFDTSAGSDDMKRIKEIRSRLNEISFDNYDLF